MGKYYTNENSIFINEIKLIERFKRQKFSTFSDLQAYDNLILWGFNMKN